MKVRFWIAPIFLLISFPQFVGAATLPELIAQLKDPDVNVRKNAAASIPSAAPPDDFTAISALNSVLNDSFEEPIVRGTAGYAVCMLDKRNPGPALSELIRLTEELRTEELTNRTMQAVHQMGDSAVDPLVNALNSNQASWSFVRQALTSIGTSRAYSEKARLTTEAHGHESTDAPATMSHNNDVTDFHRKKYGYSEFPEIKKP